MVEEIALRIPAEIILGLIGGLVSLFFALILHAIKKGQDRQEARDKKATEEIFLLNQYYFAVGELAEETAEELKERKCVNGDLDAPLLRVKESKTVFYNHLQRKHVEHTTPLK